MSELLGKLVVVKDAQGNMKGVGRVFSYTDYPTAGIEMLDGSRMHWVARMCTPLGISDEVAEEIEKHVWPVTNQ